MQYGKRGSVRFDVLVDEADVPATMCIHTSEKLITSFLKYLVFKCMVRLFNFEFRYSLCYPVMRNWN